VQTQDVDAATDMVLDRAFQKVKPKAVAPPPPAPKPRSRRDSAREPWEAQYDQVDDEPGAAAADQADYDEEMNLATLLNVLDGSASLTRHISTRNHDTFCSCQSKHHPIVFAASDARQRVPSFHC
jgi:hypothetical protein